MSAAALPPPNNMLMLAVIGIGAYWFFNQRARAAVVATPAGTTQPAPSPIASGLSALNRLLSGVQTAPISGGGTAVLTPGAGSRGTLATAQQPYTPFEDSFTPSDPSPLNPAPGYSLDTFFGGTGTSGD